MITRSSTHTVSRHGNTFSEDDRLKMILCDLDETIYYGLAGDKKTIIYRRKDGHQIHDDEWLSIVGKLIPPFDCEKEFTLNYWLELGKLVLNSDRYRYDISVEEWSKIAMSTWQQRTITFCKVKGIEL